jgi:hypothetical protein
MKRAASSYGAGLRGSLAAFALIVTIGLAQGAECRGETADSALSGAQETARKLYGIPAVAEARSEIDAATISALAPYLTDRLAAALRDFAAALSKVDQSADTSMKSPYPTGPIFYSNYEGMDGFTIVNATAAAEQAVQVTLEMNFDSPFGSAKWADVAVFRCEGDGWKLDDIIFDPNQTAGRSLRERIAVR